MCVKNQCLISKGLIDSFSFRPCQILLMIRTLEYFSAPSVLVGEGWYHKDFLNPLPGPKSRSAV